MKFEIRRVQNGAVLRVDPEQEGEEAEEYVYQEAESAEEPQPRMTPVIPGSAKRP